MISLRLRVLGEYVNTLATVLMNAVYNSRHASVPTSGIYLHDVIANSANSAILGEDDFGAVCRAE